MSFLQNTNYQPVVDALSRLGDQLNKPSLRFLKGEVIALALEQASNGRLKYVDKEGYDCVDTVTGDKYELKSVANMFSDDKVTGRVSVSNSKKSTLNQTFDYLLCIQSDPTKFAVAQLTWNEVSPNLVPSGGQFNLQKGVPINTWICQPGTTNYQKLPQTQLNIRKLLESVI